MGLALIYIERAFNDIESDSAVECSAGMTGFISGNRDGESIVFQFVFCWTPRTPILANLTGYIDFNRITFLIKNI